MERTCRKKPARHQVINPAGFIKYSAIFEGNMQDSKTLEEIVTNLRFQTSTAKRAVVVIDAGIATEANLTMLRENNFDYVCNHQPSMQRSNTQSRGYLSATEIQIQTFYQTKICSAQIGI